MAGNASDWVLDAYAATYTYPCVDCANVVRAGAVILHVLTTTPKAMPGILSARHAGRFRVFASPLRVSRSASFWLRSGGRARPQGRVVQEYAPLRCSPKPTPSGIAKRVRQNAELARRASLNVLAIGTSPREKSARQRGYAYCS
jgi:hypothetical protein